MKWRLLCRDRKQSLFHDVTAWLKHSGYNTKLVLHFTGSTVWYFKCGGHKHNFRIPYSKNCCNQFTFERVLQKRDNLRYSIYTKVLKTTQCPWMENVNVGIFIAISSNDVLTTAVKHSNHVHAFSSNCAITRERQIWVKRSMFRYLGKKNSNVRCLVVYQNWTMIFFPKWVHVFWSTSVCSGRRRQRLSEYTCAAELNKHSLATEVGGALRYHRRASDAEQTPVTSRHRWWWASADLVTHVGD